MKRDLRAALLACRELMNQLGPILNDRLKECRELQPLIDYSNDDGTWLDQRRAFLRQAAQQLNESMSHWNTSREALLHRTFDEAVPPFHQCHDLITEVIGALGYLDSARSQEQAPEPDPAPTTPLPAVPQSAADSGQPTLAAVLAAVQASDTRCQSRFDQLLRERVKPELAAVLNGLLPEQLERALLGNGLTGHQQKLLQILAAYNEEELSLLLVDALERGQRTNRLRHLIRPRRSPTQRVTNAAPDNH